MRGCAGWFRQRSRQAVIPVNCLARYDPHRDGEAGSLECIACGGTAITERSNRTVQGYRRFRCRDCGKQFNERTGGILNRAQYPSDVIALAVFWRLHYKLSLRDLSEMFLLRGFEFGPEAVRDW
jgi:putative transposase